MERNEIRRDKGSKKTENNAANSEDSDDETCPVGCKTKHHLAVCPKFQILTVNQRWEVVKQHWRCRKCLRAHHTNDCKKPDGSTCDKCRKNHHRCLHNEKTGETNTSLNPKAPPFQSQFQGPTPTSNGNIQGNAVYQKSKLKPVTGLCPVQKVKVMNKNGNFVEVLAMLDSGVEEDIKKLLHQDLLRVKPIKLCTCTENVLQESKFAKFLAASTTLVDQRIQVKMPWKEEGPSKTKQLRYRSEDDVLRGKGISKKGLLRGCKRGSAEVVRPELYHKDST